MKTFFAVLGAVALLATDGSGFAGDPEPKPRSVEVLRNLASVSRTLQLQQLVQVQKEEPAKPAQQAKASAEKTQIKFLRPTSLKIYVSVKGDDGRPAFAKDAITVPGRHNFPQGAIHRLKLTNIEDHPELELFPTIEVLPATSRTKEFLAHSSVPVEFTREDFKQIANGSFLVKVIYLPDPKFQDTAETGTDEILSARLDPGQDPLREASQRGSVLLVIRMGNKQE